MAHSFDMLTFDFLLKPPQPFTGLFFLCLLPPWPFVGSIVQDRN